MEPIRKLTSITVPLIRDNIDTDIIIPSREIKGVSKKGLSDGMFAGWRYTEVGGREPNPDFVLNDPFYERATILLGGRNFGCGSSREHAAWAMAEYGFRAIIAPNFNPIFRGNCVRNGILPVELDPEPVAAKEGKITIDLEACEVSSEDGAVWRFEIDDEARTMLLEGLDPIDLTMKQVDRILDFRERDRVKRPWIYF